MRAEESIVEMLRSESRDANEIICEILDSYMEFIDIFEKTIDKAELKPLIKDFARVLILQRRNMWQPILISSYIDSGDGRHIRISNHEKKNGLPPQMINIVYDWRTGKIDNKQLKRLIDA